MLQEVRRLYRRNQHLTDVPTIQRKIDEAEMRYGIALHYGTPHPRPLHKLQGAMQDCFPPYAPHLDSLQEDHARHTQLINSVSVLGGDNSDDLSASEELADLPPPTVLPSATR